MSHQPTRFSISSFIISSSNNMLFYYSLVLLFMILNNSIFYHQKWNWISLIFKHIHFQETCPLFWSVKSDPLLDTWHALALVFNVKSKVPQKSETKSFCGDKSKETFLTPHIRIFHLDTCCSEIVTKISLFLTLPTLFWTNMELTKQHITQCLKCY